MLPSEGETASYRRPAGRRMTLIIGLKTDDALVLAAEQEEGCRIAAKRKVNKLRLVTNDDWAVVFGAAGDAAAGDNAMLRIERELTSVHGLTQEQLQDIVDDVLATVHEKYIDPYKQHEGISLVIGAALGDELHLLSTIKRTSQFQDFTAYAGIGADVAIYFMERLRYSDIDWKHALKVAGFVVLQVKESSQYCSGESQMYVLQAPPNPRWRELASDECSMELENNLVNHVGLAEHITERLKAIKFSPEGITGYRDEHNPDPVDEWADLRTKDKIK